MSRSSNLAALVLPLIVALPAPAMCESSSAKIRHGPVSANQLGGRTLDVPPGADLQAALDDARPGDTLSLAPEATFVGPFTLPKKRGEGWIVVRSAAMDRLPADARVKPSHARLMPKLEAASGAVIVAAAGAHHYRFVGIEIRPAHGAFLNDLIRLGDDRQRKADIPSDFTFDRCYVHGDRDAGARRGLALNSSHTTVLNSHFADFKERGADSQAIAGWNGPGPFSIINNYLEAAGENVMFGGADPSIAGLVPSDIEVRHNHFAKPLAWKAASGTNESWAVKNLFELKNARRVVVEDNLFENNWVQSQSGFAVLFTVRNQDGHAPWSVVEDVTFARNVLRHSASGISILGRDDNWPSQRTQRIAIKDNLFYDIGGSSWGGGGTLLQLIGGTADVVFDHNTAFHTHNAIMADGAQHERFVFSNNIVQQNQYGIIGTGTAPGSATLAAYFPGARVERNAIVGASADSYPANNFFPSKLNDLGLAQRAQGWPRLAGSSRYRGAATDGSDVGARLAPQVAPLPEQTAGAPKPTTVEAR